MVEQQVDGPEDVGSATPVGVGPLEQDRVTPRVGACGPQLGGAWVALLGWVWVALLLASVAAVLLGLPALRAALALPLS